MFELKKKKKIRVDKSRFHWFSPLIRLESTQNLLVDSHSLRATKQGSSISKTEVDSFPIIYEKTLLI